MRLAELDGSVAQGTLQISEAALNLLVARSVEGSTRATIEFTPGNGVMLRYGVLHARAELPRDVPPASSRITIRLASVLIAMGLKAVVRVPFVEVRGRDLHIDLAAVPQLCPWRDVWQHLRRLSFETTPGALRIGFAIHVQGAGVERAG